MVYRAYRIPYAWIPQLSQPAETPIEPVDVRTLRRPGAAAAGPAQSVVRVAGVQPYSKGADALCVATDNDTLLRSPKLFRVEESRFRPVQDESALEHEGTVLLFVGAERCVHCRKLWHILAQEAAIPLTDRLDTRYLDADLNPALATRLGVRGLPALLALRGGQEISRAPAHLTSESVHGWLRDLFA